MSYLNIFNKKQTPQSEPIPGTVPNSAGGYSFALDDWKRLDRFLVLGSEGGSYYASERKLTLENAEAVIRCIEADGQRVVRRIIEISEAGRAPKNDPAIFALALAITVGSPETRAAAAEALPQVCRIGTHLFHFAQYVDGMRGWGRGLRRAVARWYTDPKPEQIAQQAVKYQQRDGWSHRDLLRLAHPIAPSESHNLVFHWITKGWERVGSEPHPDQAGRVIWAFERAKDADIKTLLTLIQDYKLPREAIPTEALTNPEVWQALLPHMGMTALIRNLATMTKVGVLSDGNREIVRNVVRRLESENELKRARVHPVAVLAALFTYRQGRGVRGNSEWKPIPQIVDALDTAFYKSFGAVEPTGKRIVLALDVSGSMSMGNIAGVPNLSPREGSAAMALITAVTETDYNIVGFSTEMIPLPISPRQRLDDAVKAVTGLPFGGTDCAQPMLWAMQNNVKADAFVVYTDSETWAGKIHPTQALQQYREKFGINAKLIVVGMLSNGFTIADPNDGGMLDVVGFDTATPNVISDFIKENI
jgi:60 kDa SS-A/Ro ribonucleoprotein